MTTRQLVIHTDGSLLKNPGRGGYCALLQRGDAEKEITGGFRKTTNNRMELMAAIAGLRALKEPCQVSLVSDSRYVVDGMSKGWARRWRNNGWRRNARQMASNPDLWEELLTLNDKHDVKFKWVRAHAGTPTTSDATGWRSRRLVTSYREWTAAIVAVDGPPYSVKPVASRHAT